MRGDKGGASPWLRCIFACLAAVLLLGGCATQTRMLLEPGAPGLPRRAELSSTPFHPQERYQCGPAALAMSLNAAGVAIGPEALVSQVYVPAREGSLQPEMLAAARRNGAVGVVIPPRLDALVAEIAAGNPVVVLQNLSLPVFPLWHYAVAIGYDLDAGTIVLRSGITDRLEMPLSTFENTWARSGYWGMVAAPPGRMPVSPGEAAIVDSLVAFERTAGSAKARGAYEAALKRWPDNLTLQVGFGNAAYAAGNLKAAESVFRRAADAHPQNAAVLNNLATVLADMGELDRAAAIAERAVALGGPWREEAEATLRSIRSAGQRVGR